MYAAQTTPIPVLQTCRARHQQWAAQLTHCEADVEQLLGLLTELPSETYRSFSHYPPDYTQLLSQLKGRIHYLLTDVVCSTEQCSSVTPPVVPCPDPHFVQPAADNSLISGIWDEYDQLKNRCHLFLGELVRLNLI